MVLKCFSSVANVQSSLTWQNFYLEEHSVLKLIFLCKAFLLAFSLQGIHHSYTNMLNPENIYKQKGKGCTFPVGK